MQDWVVRRGGLVKSGGMRLGAGGAEFRLNDTEQGGAGFMAGRYGASAGSARARWPKMDGKVMATDVNPSGGRKNPAQKPGIVMTPVVLGPLIGPSPRFPAADEIASFGQPDIPTASGNLFQRDFKMLTRQRPRPDTQGLAGRELVEVNDLEMEMFHTSRPPDWVMMR